MSMKIPSYILNLAGEYRVCSELNRQGVFATISYGHQKGADIYAISNGRSSKIEVKTTQRKNFVTKITQKGLFGSKSAPDFWVLFQISDEKFFVLSHEELCEVQRRRNKIYCADYLAKHGQQFDLATGVDNVKGSDVESFENQWSKIIERVGGPEPE